MYTRLSCVCICIYILYYVIRCCAATRPVCGGSNKPPRVRPVISRQSALYIVYTLYLYILYRYTDAQVYICAYLRPTVHGDKNRTDLSSPVRTGTQGRTRFIEIRSGLREVCAMRIVCVSLQCVFICAGRNFSDSKFNTENLPLRRRPN